MSSENEYIPIRNALKDYLKEQRITLQDLISVMDEAKEGIMKAINKSVYLTQAQSRILERELRSKDLNLLLFVIHVFYLLNPSGMYKGLIIEPKRENVFFRGKVTSEGCRCVLKALNISTINLDM